MNKRDAMKTYWDNIKAITETDGVRVQAARKFYGHISRALGDCHYAMSDEEYLSAENRLKAIRLVMVRYSNSLGSNYNRTCRR